jgi:hypothetical protein
MRVQHRPPDVPVYAPCMLAVKMARQIGLCTELNLTLE